jgi:hypothetical protein
MQHKSFFQSLYDGRHHRRRNQDLDLSHPRLIARPLRNVATEWELRPVKAKMPGRTPRFTPLVHDP